MLDSLVAVHNSRLGQPEPFEGNLVAAGWLMVKHQWPLLEISLSDFHRLAMLNKIRVRVETLLHLASQPQG